MTPKVFSSRRRHTRYWRDWSSDVCSSDLDIVCQALGFEAVYEWSVSRLEVYRVNGIVARWMQDIDLPKGQVQTPRVVIAQEGASHILRLRAGDSLRVYREQAGRWQRSK